MVKKKVHQQFIFWKSIFLGRTRHHFFANVFASHASRTQQPSEHLIPSSKEMEGWSLGPGEHRIDKRFQCDSFRSLPGPGPRPRNSCTTPHAPPQLSPSRPRLPTPCHVHPFGIAVLCGVCCRDLRLCLSPAAASAVFALGGTLTSSHRWTSGPWTASRTSCW